MNYPEQVKGNIVTIRHKYYTFQIGLQNIETFGIYAYQQQENKKSYHKICS